MLPVRRYWSAEVWSESKNPTAAILPHVAHAVELVRGYGYRGEFFIYVLAQEVAEAHDRIMRLTAIDRKIVPFCQPFRDFTSGGTPPVELRRLAR